MKPLVLLTVAWAGLVSSQCFSSIPECAQSCMTNAATESTSCGSTDWSCQCTINNQRTIWQTSQNCMFAACGQAMTYETVQPASDAFCSAINAGEACSSAGGTSTTYTSTTITMTGSMSTTSGPSGTGTAITSITGTATAATSSSTAGAAGAGSVGSFGMVILGALALI